MVWNVMILDNIGWVFKEFVIFALTKKRLSLISPFIELKVVLVFLN